MDRDSGTICLVSSGTGGHLWPALVLERALRERGHATHLITEGRAVERALLERVGCPAATLDTHRAGPSRLVRRAVEARRMLAECGARAVVCTGGRTSLVVGLAAVSRRLPVVLLEQNVVTGRANRLLARFARRVYLGLPTESSRHCPDRFLWTGTPLREGIGEVSRQAARSELRLPAEALVVLVTGGSQGAGVLNEIVPRVLAGLRIPLHVIHLTGPDQESAVRARYVDGIDHGIEPKVRPLALDMERLYAAADLVISRGGGCTVAELAAAGRAAVIVPYPHHKDRQQHHNAAVLAREGAARVIEQDELFERRLTATLRELLVDRESLDAMGRRARAAARPDPTAAILDDLLGGVLPEVAAARRGAPILQPVARLGGAEAARQPGMGRTRSRGGRVLAGGNDADRQ